MLLAGVLLGSLQADWDFSLISRRAQALYGPLGDGAQRTDLLPVYSFNAEGMWLPGAKGNKKVGDTKRLSRWQDVLKKMQARMV